MVDIGLFSRRKQRQEIRAEPVILTLEGLLGSTDKVTREQAMEIPTVSACISKISEEVAKLPVRLYRRDGDQVTEITDDSRLKLLNGETGDTLSTVDMWKAAIGDYYLGRGAWIYVNSDGFRVSSLHYVDSRDISVLTNADPVFKQFRVTIGGRMYFDFQFLKLLRRTLDGWTNIPLQEDNNTAFAAAYNSLKLENQMNAKGGCQPGFLKSDKHISAEAIAAIRENYKQMYSNDNSDQKIVVLNAGIDFQPAASTAAEMQLNENKRSSSTELCKLFGFPHTIIDGGATEDDNRKFISAVVALLNQIETALDAVLLLESEKEEGYYWAFDTKELTRGSMKERYEAYEIAVRNNILQLDEIRREEDYEPLGFNFVKLGLQDVLLNPETMEVFTPNTGQTKNLLTGEERAEDVELREYIQLPNGKMNGSTGGNNGGNKGSGGKSSNKGGKTAEKVDKSAKSDIIESEGKLAIIEAFKNGITSDEVVGAIVDNHKALAEFTPKSMKENLEKLGYIVKPLGSKSSLKNIPFEKGGGYRTSFLKDGYFQYHPANKSHHKSAYWRASCGKKGDNRYDMDGNPIK